MKFCCPGLPCYQQASTGRGSRVYDLPVYRHEASLGECIRYLDRITAERLGQALCISRINLEETSAKFFHRVRIYNKLLESRIIRSYRPPSHARPRELVCPEHPPVLYIISHPRHLYFPASPSNLGKGRFDLPKRGVGKKNNINIPHPPFYLFS